MAGPLERCTGATEASAGTLDCDPGWPCAAGLELLRRVLGGATQSASAHQLRTLRTFAVLAAPESPALEVELWSAERARAGAYAPIAWRPQSCEFRGGSFLTLLTLCDSQKCGAIWAMA
jgi:hypothetical protein